jgi:hypothetical protein
MISSFVQILEEVKRIFVHIFAEPVSEQASVVMLPRLMWRLYFLNRVLSPLMLLVEMARGFFVAPFPANCLQY